MIIIFFLLFFVDRRNGLRVNQFHKRKKNHIKLRIRSYFISGCDATRSLTKPINIIQYNNRKKNASLQPASILMKKIHRICLLFYVFFFVSLQTMKPFNNVLLTRASLSLSNHPISIFNHSYNPTKTNWERTKKNSKNHISNFLQPLQRLSFVIDKILLFNRFVYASHNDSY